MYPRISDFLNDVLGTNWNLPIQSYGFFLALTFLVAAIIIKKELKRKETHGILEPLKRNFVIGKAASIPELILAGLYGFILGFKIIGILLNYSDFALNPQEYLFSLKGNIISGLIVAAYQIYRTYIKKEKKKLSNPESVIKLIPISNITTNLIIIAAISGIIGAKIFHQFEYPNEFLSDPIEALFSFSGLTFYGGLISAAITLIIYCKKKNIPWSEVADAAAPALMLGYAIGRIGCQVSGDGDWGIVNLAAQPDFLSFLPEWTWAYDYPNNILSQGIRIPNCDGIYCYKLVEPVFPTPLYETSLCFVMFLGLWGIRKKLKISGMLFSIYLILNGIERFFIEKIRVNSTYTIFGTEITQAEIISFTLILIGILAIFYFNKKHLSNIRS